MDFEELLKGVFLGDLTAATISSPKVKKTDGIVKIAIRPLLIKSKKAYQISEFQGPKVFHRNLSPEACSEFIRKAMESYTQGIFSLSDSHYHILVSRHNKMTVIKKEIKTKASHVSHNRMKNYVLQEGLAVPFLVALGIMGHDGKVLAKKYDKFRQINRFLEMVKDVVHHLPKDRCLEIVDFGCGKAYLTFALYHYLHEIEKRKVHIVGLDLKHEVIAYCQGLAEQLKLKGLSFVVGDINHFEHQGNVDLMISLHACDTATDAALEKAVRWKAKVILCVPCCQHELYSQVQCEQFDSMLRHGILKERFAALATDAARADLLTMLGYEVQILEFIDLEHTPKNLLLRAVRGVSEDKKQQAEKRYHLFKALLNIVPSLETRFF